ncbi:MAG: M20/M25/M40 family metallo-hydrolase [Thermoplasmata archaeon]
MTDPLLRLLKELVEIDSVNDPEQGKRPSRDCADFIREQLRERGVESRVVESKGFFTVRGRLGGEEPRILLMSHWDVVPPGPASKWKYPPLSLTSVDDRAYGRGAVDDKGNVAAIITALPDILERAESGVTFAFTGDEEIGGKNGAGSIARDTAPRFVVNGDGLGLEIINRRRNIFRMWVSALVAPRRTRGEVELVRFSTETRDRETRHSAYFVPGVDSHALLAASEYALREGLAVSAIRGSFVKDNVIPDEVEVEFVREARMGRNLVVDDNLTGLLNALLPLSRITFPSDASVYGINVLPNLYWKDEGHHFKVDIRAMTEDHQAILKAAENTIQEFVPDVSMEMVAGAGCLMTGLDCPLVTVAKEVASTLGIPPRVVERQGASDSRYFSPRNIDCIDFGPLGGNIHGPNEFVVVSSLERTTKFYTELVTRLTGAE